jgi:glycine cleavage system H protein
MTNYLEFTLDKFTFKIAADRYYSEEGVWVKLEGNLAQIGISDYLQQRSGDVAFAEVNPTGTVVETIKVNISLSSPVTGKVVEINSAMETSPEIINQDPYGAGWMVVIEVTEGDANLKHLLDPQAYYSKIKAEAEQEVKNE